MRAVGAFVLALLIAIVFGRRIIDKLQLMQVGEIIRDLGLEGQMKKTGTPTMGGIIIIISTVVPCLLVGNLSNIYMILMLVSTVWLGSLGFLDDYLKIHAHNKDGLNGKFKIIGQVGLGLIVGLTMFFSPAITISEGATVQSFGSNGNPVTEISYNGNDHQVKTPATTIPFVKNNNFNYKWLTQWMGHGAHIAGWVVFILVVIFLVTATSNGHKIVGEGGRIQHLVRAQDILGGAHLPAGYLAVVDGEDRVAGIPHVLHQGLAGRAEHFRNTPGGSIQEFKGFLSCHCFVTSFFLFRGYFTILPQENQGISAWPSGK